MQITNKRSYAVAIGSVVAQPGETVEVDDEVGKAALEQTDAWGTGDLHICPTCGFESDTARGLASHQRSHDNAGDGEKES